MKKICLILLCLGFTFASGLTFGQSPAQASENFSTSLKTSYQVDPDGVTRVTHAFAIENKQPLLTITQYGLKIGSNTVTDVVVTNQGKTIPAEIVTTDNQTSVGITFPDKIVGQGKVRNFEISYLDPDAAIVSGQVLEVAVPKLENISEYSSYQVELITPPEFGAPTRVIPANFTTRSSTSQVTTTFEKLQGESIVALFGDNQVFELTLRYHLENPYSDVRLTQIALPPDTSFQRMYYHSLDPLPQSMEKDPDGNWIATYQLPPSMTTEVVVTAQAHVTLDPNSDVPVVQPTSNLTSKQPFWDTTDPTITSIAQNFTEPKQAYDYVVENLNYNYDLLEGDVVRLGAVQALASPNQALCQEFTDTFVTLARASGTPSRRIAGYAYTENEVLRPLSFVQDVLHAWPEYYDAEKKLWIPIDPTWDHTSGGINYFDQFDLNHVVFAINGRSSETPYPAGSYKTPELNTKDVEVTFGTEPTTAEPKLTFAASPFTLLNERLQVPVQTDLFVTNTTGQAHYHQQVSLSTDNSNLNFEPKDIIELDYILPFEKRKLPVTISTDNWLIPETATVTIKHGQTTEQLTIYAFPQLWRFVAGPELLFTMGIISLLAALGAWGVLVLKRKK